MQAFQAALGGRVQGLEPTSDFWAAGGDSIAAMQVLTSCISFTHPGSTVGAGFLHGDAQHRTLGLSQ